MSALNTQMKVSPFYYSRVVKDNMCESNEGNEKNTGTYFAQEIATSDRKERLAGEDSCPDVGEDDSWGHERTPLLSAPSSPIRNTSQRTREAGEVQQQSAQSILHMEPLDNDTLLQSTIVNIFPFSPVTARMGVIALCHHTPGEPGDLHVFLKVTTGRRRPLLYYFIWEC